MSEAGFLAVNSGSRFTFIVWVRQGAGAGPTTILALSRANPLSLLQYPGVETWREKHKKVNTCNDNKRQKRV